MITNANRQILVLSYFGFVQVLCDYSNLKKQLVKIKSKHLEMIMTNEEYLLFFLPTFFYVPLGKWLNICRTWIVRACVRNLDLRVQSVYKRELWASKSAGAHSIKSFKISGCKRSAGSCTRCTRANAFPVVWYLLR